jgi:chitin disaccharide deacetylase
MKKIIINADDFGSKPSVNLAIIELFNNKLINSTTLMANMPSFEDAVKLAYKNHITESIGIHLNLEGPLLTSNVKFFDLFDKEKYFDFKNKEMDLFVLPKKIKRIIYKEFSAQIEKVKKTGINITHIDTHHHVHEIFPITLIILVLLKEYNIPSMRILNNLNLSTKLYKTLYRKSVNKYLRIKGVNFSDYFGNQLQVISRLRMDQLPLKDKKLEIMVHPDYNTNGIVIDKIKNQEYSFINAEELVNLFPIFKSS